MKEGDQIVVFSRRSFDLWNTRYFVIPSLPNGWNDENRAIATFIDDSELIYPPPNSFKDQEAKNVGRTGS